MAPINWLFLFLFFISMFFMYVNFLYFNTPMMDNSQSIYKKNTNSLNWKW
nr:ATP synthase F0 subunit 8 [Triops sp. EPP1]